MSEESTLTDYKIGQDNITPFGLDIHNPEFFNIGFGDHCLCFDHINVPTGRRRVFLLVTPGHH